MINIPFNKLLFIDIETVGAEATWEDLEKNKPNLAFQFRNYFDWFQKRFPEDANKTISEMFINKSALVAEFNKIVCVSVAFVTDSNITKVQSFSDPEEKKLLFDVQKLLEKVGELGFYLCGHNVKGFDIPVLAKRMIMNGLKPPRILPGHDTKPWEIKAFDTKEFWQFGNYNTIASLELMCCCLNVPSPKTMEVTGNKVHDAFWNKKDYKGISDYCEADVLSLIDVVKKITNLK